MDQSHKHLTERLYFGDRACKSIFIDGWNERVVITVDCLSRLEVGTTTWNYYNALDIDDGQLVFDGVASLQFVPSGPLPNDFMDSLEVVEDTTILNEQTHFRMSIGSGNMDIRDKPSNAQVSVDIVARP